MEYFYRKRYTDSEDIFDEEVMFMIKVTLTNDILKKISSIDENRFAFSMIELPPMTKNRLRKNSKKKSSYSSHISYWGVCKSDLFDSTWNVYTTQISVGGFLIDYENEK